MKDLHSIQDNLLDYLAQRTATPTDFDAETDMIDRGLLDSLMLMDLVLHVQAEFGLELQAADVTPEHFRSIASLARLIHQRQLPGQTKAA